MDATPKPFRLAVEAVILDDRNRCLLVRRSTANRNFVGCWEWPGGKLAPGEDFTVGLAREVREECGLEVELTGLAGATRFAMPTVNVILLCLEARRTGGELRLSEEHDQSAWVPLAELDRWPLTEHVGPFMLDYARRKLGAP